MIEARTVTVYWECLTACCQQGIFYCDEYRDAGTVEKTVEELRILDLEHPSYWEVGTETMTPNPPETPS